MVDTTPISSASTSVSLPDFFPQQNIVVDREQHTFNVFQKDYSAEPQTEYQLDKAPINELIRVTGSYEGQTIEFTKGVDYTLSADSERIVWDESERTPTPGTIFFVTYECDSILKRYLEAASAESELTQDAIIDSVSDKFVDTASGDDLDRIGALFGDTIGDRRGRSDGDYRAYLKSVVRSFISRGTISGIKLAVSAATGVPIEDIEIREDFENNEYEIIVIPQTPVTGTTIEEIAEIADPSGVEQSITRFTPEADITAIDDSLVIKPGLDIAFDTLGAADSTASTRRGFTDIQASDDTFAINPNKFDAGVHTASASDTFAINPNSFDAGVHTTGANDDTNSSRGSASDVVSSNDVAAASETIVAWDGANWDETNWAVENN